MQHLLSIITAVPVHDELVGTATEPSNISFNASFNNSYCCSTTPG